jgi:hypothetical protein
LEEVFFNDRWYNKRILALKPKQSIDVQIKKEKVNARCVIFMTKKHYRPSSEETLLLLLVCAV